MAEPSLKTGTRFAAPIRGLVLHARSEAVCDGAYSGFVMKKVDRCTAQVSAQKTGANLGITDFCGITGVGSFHAARFATLQLQAGARRNCS